MSQVELRRGETEGKYVLRGNLSIDSVPQLWDRTTGEFYDAPALTVDLGEVERADSAGLALLIEWTRRARGSGQDIRFTNLPDQMLAIARVSGLDTMLPFHRAD